MSTTDALLRDDLRDFGGYRSARSETGDGSIWLNANESAWASDADPSAAVRRYPQPQPQDLLAALAALYAVDSTQLLIGRGSDEAIDLLLRTFCAPGQGAIVIAPPVFGMYAVCARLQAARLVEVPLIDGEDGLCVDLDAVGDAALQTGASLVFLCSPGNPSGEALATSAIAGLADRLSGRAVVVIDEAYAEYADQLSATGLLGTHDNLVVLRTLSKAHALAAARIGCAIADADLISALRRSQAPYPVPQPCQALALAALEPSVVAQTRERVAATCSERARLAAGLRGLEGVRRVYPSQGNFLLVRFGDAGAAFGCLSAAGIVVRDMRGLPQLGDALRITVGTPRDNDKVLSVLAAAGRQVG